MWVRFPPRAHQNHAKENHILSFRHPPLSRCLARRFVVYWNEEFSEGQYYGNFDEFRRSAARRGSVCKRTDITPAGNIAIAANAVMV